MWVWRPPLHAILCEPQPDLFEDLIALVALYRPGPMDNIPKYCKHDQDKVTYDYLCLESMAIKLWRNPLPKANFTNFAVPDIPRAVRNCCAGQWVKRLSLKWTNIERSSLVLKIMGERLTSPPSFLIKLQSLLVTKAQTSFLNDPTNLLTS